MKIIRYIFKFVFIFTASLLPSIFLLLLLNLELDNKSKIDFYYNLSLLVFFCPISFYLTDKYKLIEL